MSETELIDRTNMVMRASTVGFYYNSGKRCNTCRHSSCGWSSITRKGCYEFRQDPAYYWTASDKKLNLKHKKMCTEDWCNIEHGKRPEGELVEVSVPCKKTYFKAYTPKQLSDPSVKVELAAIRLIVAERGRCPRYNMVAVYDLMNDKWHNDKWWKTTKKGSLAPVDRTWEVPAYTPKDVYGIEEVIAKVKASL